MRATALRRLHPAIQIISSCAYPCHWCHYFTQNSTHALYMLTPHCSHCTLLHVSVLKGQSSGSTDTFCEQGQQNACPDVNIRLESSVLYGTWQLDNSLLYGTWQLDNNLLYGTWQLDNSLLYGTWQLDNCLLYGTWQLDRCILKYNKLSDNCHVLYNRLLDNCHVPYNTLSDNCHVLT